MCAHFSYVGRNTPNRGIQSVVSTTRPTRLLATLKTNSISTSSQEVWSEWVLYKRQPPLCLTYCWDQREGDREREMEQVTAVGKGTTFFLLLVLAASANATSLNTTQQNTAITATSGNQASKIQSSSYVPLVEEHTTYFAVICKCKPAQ